MNLSLDNLSKIVLKRAGTMPESSRFGLMMDILETMAAELLKQGGYQAFADFHEADDRLRYIQACDIKSGPSHVDYHVQASDSALATVINRWMNMQGLTNDQVDTRDEIISDLRAIMTGDSDESNN